MANFPTLSESPSVKGWEESITVDPTIKSPFEAGYVQTRAKFTRIPEKWKVVYEILPTADKDTLKVFINETVLVGSDSFNWTNPMDSVVYDVRFSGPITFSPNDNDDYWQCEFTLEEV
uniref:Uncharacterized protein n=1 Tax=viral metagenome TaxID=1070528 RepID=A0A6M3IJ44_9ZZZZ